MSETVVKGKLGDNYSVKVRSGSPALRIPENGLEHKASEFDREKGALEDLSWEAVGASG